jgi:hypothetical protein
MNVALTILETRICAAGSIDDQDVAELRGLIWEGGESVSLTLVQALFRMKDATMLGDNAPSWVIVFVEAVADYLRNQTPAIHAAADSGWHRRHIAADAGLDDLEKALHAYLADEGIHLPDPRSILEGCR